MKKTSPTHFNLHILCAITLSTLFLISCEKEIQLPLKSNDIKYVLEAKFDDSLGIKLRITKSKDFYDKGDFQNIETASVILTDNAGNSTIIPHQSLGYYRDSALLAVSGRTYTLTVTDQGNTFAATATVPNPTPIEFVSVQKFNFGGGDPVRVLQVWYNDPPGLGNHYRSVLNVQGYDFTNQIYVQDDRLSDGILNQMYVFGGGENIIIPGDTVHLGLQSIDKTTYDYYTTLDQISGGGPGGGITPSNPTSNWDNGALGLFSAYSLRGKYFVVPD